MGAGASVDWEAKIADAKPEYVRDNFKYLSEQERCSLSSEHQILLRNAMDPLKFLKGAKVTYTGEPERFNGRLLTAGMTGTVRDWREKDGNREIKVQMLNGPAWISTNAVEYLPPPQTVDVPVEHPLIPGHLMPVPCLVKDSLGQVGQRAAELLRIPCEFLEFMDGDETVSWKSQAEILVSKHKLRLRMTFDRIPFDGHGHDGVGEDVLVDGVPASIGLAKGEMMSTRICIDYKDLRPPFMTKHFHFPEPGILAWGHGDAKMKVDWVPPPIWFVKAVTVLVRSEASLDSEEMCRLTCGTSLVVCDGCFLDDDDRTPRIHIKEPVDGWITPYLASIETALILPPRIQETIPTDTLKDISKLLQGNTAAAEE